ncbi:tyrosine-type recombinase/integrase [Amycolatopsis rubida]|uniref:Tyrosine-type recombinase/integrase n=1 Tax=Amycolatopsis rubida TaxID=112413 RepID=A0ABX0BJH5_9PSEU|nr:tyrosine-type recombinase/integrase [Amycolatopsis rubida]MYW95141.1 tyrosine-type recombinase/integrase [Amycolatopsis rubida]NEC55470.1 tyrosine-type recombinase/integrase [Amycolatopsis rubida]NEC60129.1 tyrosine-type recombinase/integrase [Amycolatopsis rubida]OAP25017.1 Tyrosine recombinase XerC [Amycolatopsis sp. M39]
MVLTAVRSLGSARRPRTQQELEDFEQELVDQFALALAGAGVSDDFVASDRSVVFQFLQFLGRPVWTAQTDDADRFLVAQRKRGLARSTVYQKAVRLATFFDFLIARYQGDIHAVTGHVITQPIDEFNRPPSIDHGVLRIPPAEDEVDALFTAWRDALPETRKFLPAARDYFAASLWRRVGLRISESAMLDIRDWRPDLGEHGKLHVRFGKGSRGHGPKTRLVPAINSVDALVEWWLTDVRHQFGDDWADPDAPLLPSERRDRDTGQCLRAGANALRSGFGDAVQLWLPAWNGRLTPHVLRHFCASSLYARGMDLKAIQELLGHEWLSTTTRYIHVHDEHVERAWTAANDRVATRLFDRKE